MPDVLRDDFTKGSSESPAHPKKCSATACKYNVGGVCSAGFGISLGIDMNAVDIKEAAAE